MSGSRRVRPWVGGLLLLTAACPVRADDPIDSVMYRSPDVPPPRVVPTFPEPLLGLWLQALDRPEVDMRCQAALTIARAHVRGMSGLAAAVPALTRELDRADQHPTVRIAAARALIVLDARAAAGGLFKQAATGDIDLREIVEPALARWGYAPARGEWLKRIGQPPPHRRGTVLAIEALATVPEPKATPRLRELTLSADAPPAVRLAAARALGVLRTAGGEVDADALTADPSPRAVTARLAAASLLRHHSGDETVRRLQALVRDPEPAVAAIALARLVELDPGFVLPVLPVVLASPDANVRGLGVETLSRRPSDAHTRLLADRLGDRHPAVRSRARQVLRELAAKPEFVHGVIREGERALAGRDWRGLEQAAILLAQLDHKPAAAALGGLLDDERAEVAVAAAWGLRQLAVPDTYGPALAYFRRHARPAAGGPRGMSDDALDRQLCQLAQLFGVQKYAPAESALRSLIAPNTGGVETRAAACWALGLLYDGKPNAGPAGALAGRLAAISPFDLEHPTVRRMCATALGRMKAGGTLPTLRKFYSGTLSLDEVSNACGWAIERITGERMPRPETIEFPQQLWFLSPV